MSSWNTDRRSEHGMDRALEGRLRRRVTHPPQNNEGMSPHSRSRILNNFFQAEAFEW